MCKPLSSEEAEMLPTSLTTRESNKKRCAYSRTPSNLSSDSSTASLADENQARRANKNKRKRRGKKKTKTQQKEEIPMEEQAQYVALDCEMVGVGMDGRQSTLARVVLVDWNGQVVYDAYIKPDREVTDYRTFVSGITEEHLKDGISFDECKVQVEELLKGKIVVGHHLKNDFRALGIQHPWEATRDTAKYQPFQKTRPGFDDGILWPRKLKDLCQEKLKREIQIPGRSHCPFEDAVAALDLYKSVRTKFEKVMDYKIKRTHQIMQEQQQAQ